MSPITVTFCVQHFTRIDKKEGKCILAWQFQLFRYKTIFFTHGEKKLSNVKTSVLMERRASGKTMLGVRTLDNERNLEGSVETDFIRDLRH